MVTTIDFTIQQKRFDSLIELLKDGKTRLKTSVIGESKPPYLSENEVALWITKALPALKQTKEGMWCVEGLSDTDEKVLVEELDLSVFEVRNLVAVFLNQYVTADYSYRYLKAVVKMMVFYAKQKPS